MTRSIVFSDTDTNFIKIEFPYDKQILELVRSIPGRQWWREEKCWTIPRTPETLKTAINTLRAYHIKLDPDLPLVSAALPDPSSPSTPEIDRRLGFIERRRTARAQHTDRRGRDFTATLIRQLRIRNYSPRTIKLYKNILLDLSRFFAADRPIDTLTADCWV